ATFPKSVVEISDTLLKNPERIQLDVESKPAENITQRAIEVEQNQRTALLRHLLKSEEWTRVLVFVATKRRAANVTAKLTKQGIRASVLHGDLKQDQRTRALENFKNGKTQVLMATDLAARGIHIEQLPCVINYDLPRSPTDYVHRIGRTGRAGESGTAISFITAEEHRHFQLIEKRHDLDIERERVEGFIPLDWDPDAIPVPTAPVKGKRKSKKDKSREAAARKAHLKREAAGENQKSEESETPLQIATPQNEVDSAANEIPPIESAEPESKEAPVQVEAKPEPAPEPEAQAKPTPEPEPKPEPEPEPIEETPLKTEAPSPWAQSLKKIRGED
ncbi:MAG: helicase C-terminal domain-containing protein, partial [Opitutaceae bacterium]|nr:helicase C-terminal domain-containing protein [Opitutaceae bacterium]